MKIAILGARGLIGRMFLQILEGYENEEQQNFLESKIGPEKTHHQKTHTKHEIDCFGASYNEEIHFNGHNLKVQHIDSFDSHKYDLIFSAMDNEATEAIKEKIVNSRAVWIDKSSLMRLDSDVPLVVDQVNDNLIENHRIIASPNCNVIPIATFLKAVDSEIQHLNIATYQSVSGAGKKAIDAFFKEVKASMMENLQHGLLFEHPLAFNVIPAIGDIEENGNSDEENKVCLELRKIFPEMHCPIIATCVRVSSVLSHLISLNFQLKAHVNKESLIKKMEKVGIVYSNNFVTPIMAANEEAIFACRLREHENNWYSIILVADNLRAGGALNAFKIAQQKFKDL
jgi:aspartate-semialdehyde dehydrogenase